MAELTTLPTEYGFGDQGFLAEGIQAGDTTCTISPIYRYENGIRTKQGFNTEKAFIYFELAGEYERASYGVKAVDSTTFVTTLSDMRRELSLEDGNDITSQGSGRDWPRGTRVVVSNDPALFGGYINSSANSTITGILTFSAKPIFSAGTRHNPFADATARDAVFTSPVNGDECFVNGTGKQIYNGGWQTVGVSTVFDASTTVKGLVEEATEAEVRAETATGGTSAKLFIPASSTAVLKDDRVVLKDATELTISGGVITVTQPYHTVDTESDAATDDLDTITAQVGAGELIILRAIDTSRTVVVKHGTGNILTVDGSDFSLDDTEKTITLLNDGTNWKEVSRAVPLPVISTPETAILQTTRNVTAATGTVNLAHGMSGTPDLVMVTMKIKAGISSTNETTLGSDGSSDGTNNKCTYSYESNPGGVTYSVGNQSSYCIYFGEDGTADEQKATITLDSTNVTLNWTKVGSPTSANMAITLTAIKF